MTGIPMEKLKSTIVGLAICAFLAAVVVTTATAAPRAPGRSPLIGAAPSTSKIAPRVGGVGMVLDGRGGRVVVARVVPGGPAAQAGVKPGDVVLSVDGADVQPGAPVSKVAGMVRGPVGGSAALRVQRDGALKPLILQVRRADLSLLFPKRARRVLVVEPGLALIATSGRWSLGVMFPRGGAQGDLLTYQWALVSAGQKLSAASAQRGLGAVAWGRGGATVQIGDWRLDLKPWPAQGKLIVADSNLPLAPVAAAEWVAADPATAQYVRPRAAPQSYRIKWPAGPCTLRLQAQVDGSAAADYRLTLRMTDAQGDARPTPTVRMNASGGGVLRLPAGRWIVNGLQSSLAGAGHDLFYAATLPETITVRCKAGETVDVTVATKRPVATQGDAAPTLPAAAFQHSLVGQPLPDIAVQKWLGGQRPLGGTLKGKVLLVYFWATWCGPCKRVSPMMSELHARLGARGLVVVPTSVDRDELALQDYVDAELEGAPAVAWVGPEPLAKLPIRGIPTVVAIDDLGIVRAVHTGTGVEVAAWSAWLMQLLDEAQGRRPRSRAPVAAATTAAEASPARAQRGHEAGSRGKKPGKKPGKRPSKTKPRHK